MDRAAHHAENNAVPPAIKAAASIPKMCHIVSLFGALGHQPTGAMQAAEPTAANAEKNWLRCVRDGVWFISFHLSVHGRRFFLSEGKAPPVCYPACMQHLNTIINGLVVLLVGLILWIVADIRNDIRHLHTRIDNVLLSRSAEARE